MENGAGKSQVFASDHLTVTTSRNVGRGAAFHGGRIACSKNENGTHREVRTQKTSHIVSVLWDIPGGFLRKRREKP